MGVEVPRTASLYLLYYSHISRSSVTHHILRNKFSTVSTVVVFTLPNGDDFKTKAVPLVQKCTYKYSIPNPF